MNTEWKSWFAIFPVKIENRPDTYVFLNWVARRKVNDKWQYVWCYPSPCGRDAK